MSKKQETYPQLVGFPRKGFCDKKRQEAVKRAFKFANDCRDKEIDRFWTRGLYFWGFIVASFGAYMAVFNAALENENGIKVALSRSAILEMSFTAKTALFALSFICFVFCLSWLLIHKGSKFWQESWETHIYHLEKEYMGEIYWTFLDTKNKNKFSGCILSVKPYNYSVTKISALCSSLLTFCSIGLTVFHAVLLIFSLVLKNDFDIAEKCRFLLKIITVLMTFILTGLFVWYFCKNEQGNKNGSHDVYCDKKYNYFCNKHNRRGEILEVEK